MNLANHARFTGHENIPLLRLLALTLPRIMNPAAILSRNWVRKSGSIVLASVFLTGTSVVLVRAVRTQSLQHRCQASSGILTGIFAHHVFEVPMTQNDLANGFLIWLILCVGLGDAWWVKP